MITAMTLIIIFTVVRLAELQRAELDISEMK
jgi:hypothetical protein